MVKPTGADDADSKVFSNLVSFLACDDAAGGLLPSSINHGTVGCNVDSFYLSLLLIT